MLPYLTAPVLYTDGAGLTFAAIVITTLDGIDQQSVDDGSLLGLDSPSHAHLFALTAGGRGNMGGYWPVYDVPYSATAGAPNTWAWPPVPTP